MAYAAVVTKTERVVAGRRTWRIAIAETEAAVASEWSASLDYIGPVTLTRFILTRSAGTAATVQPKLGTATGLAGLAFIAQQAAAVAVATGVNDPSKRSFNLTDGKLYGRSTPDAGADNTFATVLELTEGVV